MRKIYCLLFATLLISQLNAQCIDDVTVELPNSYNYNPKMSYDNNSFFMLGVFNDEITLGGTSYTARPQGDPIGKYLVKYDLGGNLIDHLVLEDQTGGVYGINPPMDLRGDNFTMDTVFLADVRIGEIEDEFVVQAINGNTMDVIWESTYPIPKNADSPLQFNSPIVPYALVAYEDPFSFDPPIYIAGAYSGTIDFGGGNVITTAANKAEMFLLSISPNNGSVNWVQSATSTGDFARVFNMLQDGNDLVMSGDFKGDLDDFGSISYAGANPNDFNAFVMKYNPWEQTAYWIYGAGESEGEFTYSGTSRSLGLTVDGENNYIFGGTYSGTTFFEGLPEITSAANGEAFVVSVSEQEGTPIGNWVTTFGGAGTNEFVSALAFSDMEQSILVFGQNTSDQNTSFNGTALAVPFPQHYMLSLNYSTGEMEWISGINTYTTTPPIVAYMSPNESLIIADFIYNNNVAARILDLDIQPGPLVSVTRTGGDIVAPGSSLSAYDAGDYNFQWIMNGNPTGTTSSSIDIVSSGTYAVQVTSPGGCSVLSQEFVFLSDLQADSLVLIDFYNATGGDNWTNNSGWLESGVALEDWYGVRVEDGRVIEINLGNNNLTGTLPISLIDLAGMRFFYVWQNPELQGELFQIIKEWPLLERVSAHDCALTGNIDPAIFTLSNLIELRLFNNTFGGGIPNQIGNAQVLEQFEMANCGLSGTIPTTITNVETLRIMDLRQNELTGSIPEDIGQLSSLLRLDLSSNNLEGNLPASFYDLRLEELYLQDNDFDGQISSRIDEMGDLWNIHIGGNSFSGELPESLTNLSNLRSFYLYQNDFSGILPNVMGIEGFERIDCYGNGKLKVEIPADIGTYSSLRTFAIGGTIANRGEFPEGFYDLGNIEVLDLGGQQYSGQLNEAVANWQSLIVLRLWQNRLSGDLPEEIAELPNLEILDINQNSFTGIPDFSSTSVRELLVVSNRLSFSSLLPNLALPVFNFRNQQRIGGDQDIVLELGASVSIEATLTEEDGAVYTWSFNGDDIDKEDFELQINNFDITQSGSYGIRASHPDIENFTLVGGFINIKMPGEARSWFVDNRPGKVADFNSFMQAVYATKANDTLYVMGSDIEYQSTGGGILITEPRVILGPGYFLNENSGLQQNTDDAVIANPIILRDNAHGTIIRGLTIGQNITINNSFFTQGDTLNNITIVGNRFLPDAYVGVISHLDGFVFKQNYGGIFAMYSTDIQGRESGLYASYKNWEVENNIGIVIRPFSFEINNSAENNKLENVVFRYNLIDNISNVSDVLFENNIIKEHTATNNTFNDNIDYAESLFTNASGGLNIDSDFIPADAELMAGPYAGPAPYRISGVPEIPAIYLAEQAPMLNVSIGVWNNSPGNESITRIRLSLFKDNQLVNNYTTRNVPDGSEIEFEHFLRLNELTPNENYTLMLTAVDSRGVRSHRTYIPFEALAARLSGRVLQNVDEGIVRAMRVVPGRAYDTTAVVNIASTGNYAFNELFLGNYLLLADPDVEGKLPTYFPNTIDWQNATEIAHEAERSGVDIVTESLPEEPLSGEARVSGLVEQEFEENEEDDVLRRGVVQGAGVSVRTTGAVFRNLRDANDGYELVAYVKTDENGRFDFSRIPAGTYRLRVDMPGVPVNEQSEFEFTLRGVAGEEIEFAALATEEGINIERVRYLSVEEQREYKIYVFPNPSKGLVKIKLDDKGIEPFSIEVLDVQGKLQHQISFDPFRHNDIDLSDLRNGLYILRFNHKDGAQGISRIVIKK